MSVSRRHLRGHKDAIVSLDSPDDSDILLSGSEDGTLRLWDLRTKLTSIRLIRTSNIGDMGYCRLRDNLVSASVGSKLFGFDLRQCESIIVTNPTLCFPASGDDDINDYHADGDFFLLPTDSGHIRKVNKATFKEEHSSDLHSNIASVCRLLPCGDQLVSGGYDCRLATARLGLSGLEAGKDFSVSSLIPIDEDEDGYHSGQTINPPFVTGLEVSPNKQQLAVALGDGSVFAMDLRKGGSKIDTRRPAWGGVSVHAASVASICWSCDSESLWSVGNDSVLLRMNDRNISVRYALEGFKPNSVVEISRTRIAVAGTSNDIELLDFS
jgi:WD40 repeat protein